MHHRVDLNFKWAKAQVKFQQPSRSRPASLPLSADCIAISADRSVMDAATLVACTALLLHCLCVVLLQVCWTVHCWMHVQLWDNQSIRLCYAYALVLLDILLICHELVIVYGRCVSMYHVCVQVHCACCMTVCVPVWWTCYVIVYLCCWGPLDFMGVFVLLGSIRFYGSVFWFNFSYMLPIESFRFRIFGYPTSSFCFRCQPFWIWFYFFIQMRKWKQC
jgi:hypothetical protein